VKSAILFAGLNATGRTTVIETTASRDHTERLFNGFGVPVTTNTDLSITLDGPARFTPGGAITIPGRRLIRQLTSSPRQCCSVNLN
jgi:3-phosphoshikimate 1-carboxyvinyltransferase